MTILDNGNTSFPGTSLMSTESVACHSGFILAASCGQTSITPCNSGRWPSRIYRARSSDAPQPGRPRPVAGLYLHSRPLSSSPHQPWHCTTSCMAQHKHCWSPKAIFMSVARPCTEPGMSGERLQDLPFSSQTKVLERT